MGSQSRQVSPARGLELLADCKEAGSPKANGLGLVQQDTVEGEI